MRIAVAFLAIVASLWSIASAVLVETRDYGLESLSGPEVRRDGQARELRRQLGEYLAGATGVVAAVVAIRALEKRRFALACGMLLVAAALIDIIGASNRTSGILFGTAAFLSFLKACVSSGPSASRAEMSLPDPGRHGKAPVGWALLRILGILGYLFGAAYLFTLVSWPLYVLWRGYPFPPIAWHLQIGLCLFFFVFLALGLLLARWVANRFYGSVTIPKGKFTGHLVLVPAAGILSWLAIARPEEDGDIAQLFFLAGAALFLVAVIDGLVTLVRYKPYRWHIYILMAIGIGCGFASLIGPTFFVVHAAVFSGQRSSTFAATTREAESRVRYKDFANAIRESKQVRKLADLKGAMLVYDAHLDEHEAESPCRLTISPMERHLPQEWLAKDEQSLRLVVVVGPFGLLPSSQLLGRPTWGCPFVVFDWPKRELIQQGTLPLSQPGGLPRQHYPDMAEGRLCDAAKELVQRLSLRF